MRGQCPSEVGANPRPRVDRRAPCHTRRLATQAVLFDLDGTLVDLRTAYLQAHRLTAREVLAVELDDARILQLMATGSPIRTHMAQLDETAADLLVDVFVERYREARDGLARVFPGMRELLHRLQVMGVPVAVVTSKLRDDAVAELAATGLDELAEHVIAFEDTDEHKPSPAPHLAALRRLGVDRGIGVGDLPSDVASARAAGLTSLAVAWGYGDSSALQEAGAEKVCETAAELAAAVDDILRRPRPTASGVALNL
jgi:pyrophosphatase PpaX